MVQVSRDADEMRRIATQVVMLRRGCVTTLGGAEVLPAAKANRSQRLPV
jgi:molybdate transport system ATP-binding protein